MTSGEARFEEVAPGRTRIDATMNHPDPPGGVGEAVANVLSNPERNLKVRPLSARSLRLLSALWVVS